MSRIPIVQRRQENGAKGCICEHFKSELNTFYRLTFTQAPCRCCFIYPPAILQTFLWLAEGHFRLHRTEHNERANSRMGKRTLVQMRSRSSSNATDDSDCLCHDITWASEISKKTVAEGVVRAIPFDKKNVCHNLEAADIHEVPQFYSSNTIME